MLKKNIKVLHANCALYPKYSEAFTIAL